VISGSTTSTARGPPGLHGVDRHLDAEGGRGAGHVHVEAEALDAQRGLDLDRHGRVGALHVGAGADHAVHIGGGLAGALQRLFGGGHGDLGHHGDLGVRARGEARAHALGVQHALFFHHVAALDARGFFDEFDAGHRDRGARAGGDLGRVGGVFLLREGVERDHQFFVGDDVRRDEQPGAADGN
jgi:hypothetical protein